MANNIIEALKQAEELRKREQELKRERQALASTFIKENALDDKARALHLVEAQAMIQNGQALIEDGRAQIALARQILDFIGYQQEAGLARHVFHSETTPDGISIKMAGKPEVKVNLKHEIATCDFKGITTAIQSAMVCAGYDVNSARNRAWKEANNIRANHFTGAPKE